MTKRLRWLLVILFFTIGCGTFVTGEKHIDPKTGEVTYGPSAMVELSSVIGGILGVGTLAAAATRIAVKAVRVKNALYDTNEKALETADWKNINSAASFKIIMKAAQDSHDDSILLKNGFNKWNDKRKKKALKKELKIKKA